MKPNRYMNGGAYQTAQNAYYVDDDAPRLILNIDVHAIYNNEPIVLVSAVIKSSENVNSVWHTDVIDPKMQPENESSAYLITSDDLIFSF